MIKIKCENVQDYLFLLAFARNRWAETETRNRWAETETRNRWAETETRNRWAETETIDTNFLQNLLKKIRVALHLMHCQNCSDHKRIVEKTTTMMLDDFFPQSDASNEISDAVMKIINMQSMPSSCEVEIEGGSETFSLQTWVIAGLIIMVSLLSAYFSISFLNLQESHVFLVPMAITIGSVITAYGAIFIGTHLKELSKRFGISI